MDTLTHALSGALLARATHHSAQQVDHYHLSLRARLISGFLVAAFPDSDFIMRSWGVLTYLEYHRGLTHSIIMAPLWALLLAWLLSLMTRQRYHWRAFYLPALLSLCIHIAGDVITAFGTMVLQPFTDMKLALPTTFIIDFYFTGIILCGLFVSWLWKVRGQRLAQAALLVLLSYIGYQGLMHQQALQLGEQYAALHHLQARDIVAMPQFLSPWHWKILISTEDSYHVSYVHLYRQQPYHAESDSFFARVKQKYLPHDQLQWITHARFRHPELADEQVDEVWNSALLRPLRKFMLYPSLQKYEQRDEGQCYWFVDHRFVVDGLRAAPFQFAACDKQQAWSLYRLTDGELRKI